MTAPLVRWGGQAELALPLVCFPWAGAGASPYRDWSAHLPPDIEVWGARLPGRESRIGEKPVGDIRELASRFAAAMRRQFAGPVALFGHCSGALLAYELAVELGGDGPAGVSHLILASQEAPKTARAGPAQRLDPREELRALGYAENLFGDGEMLDLLLPAIEADFTMAADYRADPDVRLDVPVTALIGTRDDALDRDRVEAWRRTTSGRSAVLEIEGDHLFTGSDRSRLIEAVGAAVLGSVR
jgi:medium-chain acyl-[acyl-carrier-protein] hydrolase